MGKTILATLVAAVAAFPLVLPDRAAACGGPPIEGTVPFALEQALGEDGGADAPPLAPVVLAARLEHEAEDDDGAGCGPMAAQPGCDSHGALVIELEPPVGEGAGGAGGTGVEPQIGWLFRVVEGDTWAELPEGPVVPESGGSRFAFMASNGSADLVLEVVAVNRAGLESAPTQVHVRDAGPDDEEASGCAAAGAGRSLPWLVLVGVLALRRRIPAVRTFGAHPPRQGVP